MFECWQQTLILVVVAFGLESYFYCFERIVNNQRKEVRDASTHEIEQRQCVLLFKERVEGCLYERVKMEIEETINYRAEKRGGKASVKRSSSFSFYCFVDQLEEGDRLLFHF